MRLPIKGRVRSSSDQFFQLEFFSQFTLQLDDDLAESSQYFWGLSAVHFVDSLQFVAGSLPNR